MAYKVQRINPLDLQLRKAVGVAIPFQDRAVFTSTYSTKDAIKSNLLNFFLTGKNERVLNVDFGSGIRNFLFEGIVEDNLLQAKLNIEADLKLYFPQVSVKELVLESTPDTNILTFKLKYSVSQTNIVDEISINFEQ
jgi:phage baseplate assembly protein W